MTQDSPREPRLERYARVRQILDLAAGSAEPAYDGQGRFWNRSLREFEATEIYGIAMVAPPGTPDRGAASGLVRGLRGQWPFDGTQFPPLPWGGRRVAAPDMQLISDWIDAGLPEADAPEPAAPVEVQAPTDDPNAHREQLGAIKARQDVEHLSDTELANLRGAIAELMALNNWPRDRRSYNAWAQLHGDECPHGWSIFLPWHRMYLWGFEHQLQDISPSVTLPYWDWTQSTPQQIADGHIPEAFRCWVTDQMLSSLSGKISAETIKRLEAVEGQTFNSIKRFWAATGEVPESEQTAIVDALKVANPLFSEKRWPGDFSSGDVDPRFDDHYPRPADIERIVAIDNWRDFGGGMDVDQSFGIVDMDPHNTMHVWIGGSPKGGPPAGGLMANNLTAAFDPIFWAHHANVDRIWALWQERHPGVDPPDPGDVLPGVSSTVQDSLNFHKLGYEYAADTHLLLAGGGEPAARLSTPMAGAVRPVLTRQRRAEVRLHRIRQPKRSFVVRVFLNAPDADVSTSLAGNPHYAGHFTLFGHGPCIGGPGHCDPRPRARPFDTRPQQHNEPWDVRFDVTDTVAALVGDGATDIDVTLVVVAPGGDDPRAQLQLDGMSLSFHD
jgi:tyrosinase